MLSSSLLRALLFLLVTSYVSAKKNNTTYSDQEVKNQTSEKRQSIGKWLLTVTPWVQLYCLDVQSWGNGVRKPSWFNQQNIVGF